MPDPTNLSDTELTHEINKFLYWDDMYGLTVDQERNFKLLREERDRREYVGTAPSIILLRQDDWQTLIYNGEIYEQNHKITLEEFIDLLMEKGYLKEDDISILEIE